MKNVHTLTIKLEGQDWTKILDETFKKKNAEVTIDGFRKGKAPKDRFIKKFGIESLFMDSIDAALPTAYERVLKDNDLVPACEPKVDVKDIGEDHVEFEFTVITKPEVKIAGYKKLGVKKEVPKVTKKEVEEELERMRGRFAEMVVKETGKVEKGDVAVIDFKGYVDGEAFDGGEGTDYPLEIGSNTFIPGFEDGLVGAEKGKEVDVKVKFPEDYVENLKGKEAVFKVVVKEIKARILPEIDEEFFKDLGYEDIKTKAELEKKIEEHILEHKTEDAENQYIDSLIEAGVEKMTVEVNDEIVDDEVHRMMHDLGHRLESQGVPLEAYLEFTGTTMEAFKEQSKPEALKRIKARYFLDAVVEQEKLTATEDEVMKHAEEQASKYGVDKEEIINMYGGIEVVKYDLLIHKAIKVLEG